MRVICTFCVLIACAYSSLAQPNFTASATEGCTPFKVKFDIDPTTIKLDTVRFITWNFGFGDTLDIIHPDTITYQKQGKYTVSMIINGDRNHPVTKTITVHRTVVAAFNFEEYKQGFNYIFKPIDRITDTSATYFFMWRYKQLNGTINIVNGHTVKMYNQKDAFDTVTLDTGNFIVQLRVKDTTYGCLSSYSRIIHLTKGILVPNVFDPQYQLNYIINPENSNVVLNFKLFTRYGLLVFEQTAPIINWDGRTESGLNLNTGVYFYILKAVRGDPYGQYTKKGFIHLYRRN